MASLATYIKQYETLYNTNVFENKNEEMAIEDSDGDLRNVQG